MRRLHFLVQKTSEFFEIYGVSARTFFGQGGVNFFAILCERPLWTAPYNNIHCNQAVSTNVTL